MFFLLLPLALTFYSISYLDYRKKKSIYVTNILEIPQLFQINLKIEMSDNLNFEVMNGLMGLERDTFLTVVKYMRFRKKDVLKNV
jgi:hypothetical protein